MNHLPFLFLSLAMLAQGAPGSPKQVQILADLDLLGTMNPTGVQVLGSLSLRRTFSDPESQDPDAAIWSSGTRRLLAGIVLPLRGHGSMSGRTIC